MKKTFVMVVLLSAFLASSCQGSVLKKAVWTVVPYAKNQALIHAAKKGDVVGVKKALKAKANSNAKDKHGLTAMIYAARNGHNEIVKVLIASGVNVNTKFIADKPLSSIYALLKRTTTYEYTALFEAVRFGHNEVVKTLIAAGADVNALVCRHEGVVSYYDSPLVVASSPLVIETLVNAGAEKISRTHK